MRAWIIVGFLVAAGLALVAFLDRDAILSAEEAALVVAGEIYPNSKCLPAGDCDGLNYNIVYHCPTPSGWCTTCLLNGTTPTIYGCQGNQATSCTYPGGAFTDCGTLWLGLCNEANQCVLIGPTGTECSDARMCLTL